MKTAVFAFGRMNPPTVGHGKLVDKVKAVARAKKGTPLVFLSHTHNDEKDPLPYIKKVKYAQSAFGRDVVKKSTSKTVIKVVQEIEKMGYDECIMVAGSDRVQEFKTLLTKYNGKEWNFKKVDVVSAGQRDPDAEGVEGMSATKVRAAARAKDFKTFKQGIAKGVNITSLYKDLSEESIMDSILSEEWEPTDEEIDLYLSFHEEWDDDEEIDLEDMEGLEDIDERVLTVMQRIKRGRVMKRKAPMMKRMRKIKSRRMAPRSRLAYRARKAAIGMLRKRFGGSKGSKYASLSIGQKIQIDKQIDRRKGLIDKISKRMLPKVRKKEINRLRSARSGGVQQEALDMDINEEFEQIFETNYKVEVPGLPTFYVPGKSPAEVRRKMRDTIKPGMMKDIEITRVVDADVKKAFRLKAQGKDEEGEEVEEMLKPTAAAKAYQDQMDNTHALIYPKKQAIKWKTKPPKGTKNVHPDSKWPGMKDGDIEKHNEPVDEARRGRPSKNPTGDEEQGGEHIIMQLRKSVSLNGRKEVEFVDGSKATVDKRHAQQALSMHQRMRRSDEKGRFEKHINMGHKHLKDAIAGKEPPKRINPLSRKADHSWMDDPKGHRWKMESVQVDELSVDTLSSYIQKASDARGHRKLPTSKVDNRYSGVKKADDKINKHEKDAMKKAQAASANEEVDLDFESFLIEKPTVISKMRDDKGRRIEKRSDGSTTTSGASGAITRDKEGFKTKEQTPRIGGMSVTRKYDPNEKDLDPDQTSDDATSSTTNYRGRDKKTGTRMNITMKGDAERETGRDMTGKDPVTGKSNIRKMTATNRGVTVSRDNDKKTTGVKMAFGPNSATMNKKDGEQGTMRVQNPSRGIDRERTINSPKDTSFSNRNRENVPSRGFRKPNPTTPKVKPAVGNPNPRLASVEGYQADYKEYDWHNPQTKRNEKKKVKPRLREMREDAKTVTSLIRKAVESKLPRQVIFEVYNRGMAKHNNKQKAFDRVNSFINKGKALELDRDLIGDDR